MANIYYGDGGFSVVTGNWNTIANWFLSITACDCCTQQPGTPAGRVPAAGDTVILTCNGPFINSPTAIHITTGPTGGWAGPVQAQAIGQDQCLCTVSAGSYSGVWDWSAFLASFPVSSAQYELQISGGTFTGSFAALAGIGSAAVSNRPKVVINGGTFAPTFNTTQSSGVLDVTGFPQDPGFAYGGGSFAPIVNITNLPAASDILGAGLP